MKYLSVFFTPAYFNRNYIRYRIFSGILIFTVFYLFSPFRIYSLSPVYEQAEEWTMLYGSILIFVLLYLIRIIFTKVDKLHFTAIDLSVSVYFIYLLLRISLDDHGSGLIFRVFGLFLFYFCLRSVPLRFYPALLYTVAGCCFIQILYSMLHFENPWDTLKDSTGIFHNTGIFGGFVGLSVVILWVLIPSRWYFRLLTLILSIPLGVQLYVSHSRASWVALGGVLIYLFTQKIILKIRSFRPIARISVLLLSVLLFAGAFKMIYEIRPASANGRIYTWGISADLFKNNFIQGVGIDNFRLVYMPAQAAFFEENPESPFRLLADEMTHPFNEFLKTGVEQGVLGLFLLIFLFYCVFFRIPPERNDAIDRKSLRKTFISLLIYLFLFALFSYPYVYIQFIVFTLICLGGLSGLLSSQNINISRQMLRVIMIGLLGGITFVSYNVFINFNYILQWNEVRNHPQMEMAQKVAHYRTLYPVLYKRTQFLITYYRILMQNHQYKEALGLLEEISRYQVTYVVTMDKGICHFELGNIEQALESFHLAAAMIPSRFRPDYMIIKTYIQMGNQFKATQWIESFFSKPVKVSSPELDRMKEEILKLSEDFRIPCTI